MDAKTREGKNTVQINPEEKHTNDVSIKEDTDVGNNSSSK